jgi:peptide/nickel transport system permease protein/oligopeptide transport system permease protein
MVALPGFQQAPGEPTLGTTVRAAAEVEGRSLGRIAWMRLRRDKVAMAGGAVIVVLIAVAIIGPYLEQNPDAYNSSLINPTFSAPTGRFGGISLAHPLGVEPVTGRDMLSRIVNGARYSLVIGFLATAFAVSLGVLLGMIAGYLGGWVDALIARVMDLFLAFPLLLFAIALVGVIPDQAFGLAGNSLRVALLIFLIGLFTWPYMGRIVRGQVLSLREREFIEAARSLGARTPYILFRELLPNLVAPVIVYATLLIPQNILFESYLDFLGVGLIPPTPSWGDMLSDAVTNSFYSIDPMFMIIPGLAIFITVMAFNLFGDGLRDALDSKTRLPASQEVLSYEEAEVHTAQGTDRYRGRWASRRVQRQ